MATASVTNTFVASTAAVASEVNTNFTDLVTFLNNQVIHKDGSKAFTGNMDAGSNKIVNLSNGTASTDAVNKSQLDAVDANTNPAGAILMYGGAAAPSGWLLCNGSAVSRTTYADLFAVVGTTFGVGDGSTTFNLPNFQDRFPAGLGADADSFADTLGGTGGSQDAVVVTHTHTDTLTAPAHTHSAGSLSIDSSARFGSSQGFLGTGSAGTNDFFPNYNNGSFPTYGFTMSATDLAVTGTSGGASATALTGSIDNTGVSGTNANLPPYLTVNFIIKT